VQGLLEEQHQYGQQRSNGKQTVSHNRYQNMQGESRIAKIMDDVLTRKSQGNTKVNMANGIMNNCRPSTRRKSCMSSKSPASSIPQQTRHARRPGNHHPSDKGDMTA
jgi:hypothetical protein